MAHVDIKRGHHIDVRPGVDNKTIVWDSVNNVLKSAHTYQISNNILHSHDTLEAGLGFIKTITLITLYPTTTTIRTYFEAKPVSSTATATVQIYRNGEPYGTAHDITGATTFQSFTEDLEFSVGDKIQIYGTTSDGTSIDVQNFRILGDFKIPIAINS